MDINIPIPYARNPRNNDAAVDKVAASIKEFGFQQPIVVDKENVIIVGHTRLLAAKKLGLKEVPVTVADKLTPQQIKAYRIADNKTADFSEFNDELLVLEIQDLIDANYNIDLTGFDIDELSDLLQIEQEGLTDEDDIPEVPLDEPTASLGDLYKLGEHRLLCGDATKEVDVKELMGDKKAAMVFTDPPFNIGLGYNKYEDTKSEKEYAEFVDKFISNLVETVDQGMPVYIMSGELYLNVLVSKFKEKLRYSETLIWVKPNPNLSNYDYLYNHEAIIYGWKKGKSHKFYGSKYEKTAIEFGRDLGNKSVGHPAQRPISLLSYYLKNSSKIDDIVIDTFGGSGSTLIACEKINRKCYMMELDPHYVDVIIKRWEDFTGKKAKLISNDKDTTQWAAKISKENR